MKSMMNSSAGSRPATGGGRAPRLCEVELVPGGLTVQGLRPSPGSRRIALVLTGLSWLALGVAIAMLVAEKLGLPYWDIVPVLGPVMLFAHLAAQTIGKPTQPFGTPRSVRWDEVELVPPKSWGSIVISGARVRLGDIDLRPSVTQWKDLLAHRQLDAGDDHGNRH